MPFAGQTGNAQAENASATLILFGCRDVKQLRSANQILRIPFQCQSRREFLWMCLHLLTLQFCSEHLTLGDRILQWKKSQIFSFFLVKTWTACGCREEWRELTRQSFEIQNQRPLASGKPQTANHKPHLRVCSFALPRFHTLARRSVQFIFIQAKYNTIQEYIQEL